MSKSENKNIKIFFRFFPMEKMEWEYIKVDQNTVYMRHLQELSKTFNQNEKPPTFWEFKTDGVFFNIDQKYVYTNVMDGVLDRIMEGNNGIILAFGQTRTGKTVTVGGLHLSEDDFGIIPRVIFDLFKIKRELPKNMKMCIQISYTEFTDTKAADLLKTYPYSVDVYHCREATKIKVKSEYEALRLLYKGEGRKSFAGNSEYLSNLRSTVVTFHITTADLDFSSPRKNCRRLHIIDMAGVDTIGSASSVYKYPPDIGKANIIKTNLEQFVLSLRKNIPLYIRLKERTNALIYFLGSDLSNESIFRFIGHIRTPREDLTITISMLRFGQMVRGLKPKHKEIIPEVNEDVQLQHLQDQLEYLETEKLQNSVLLNQDLTQNMNKDRVEHIQRLIQEYLKDHISEITVLNVADAAEVFRVFKQMCTECETEKNKLSEEVQLEISKNRRESKTSSKSSLKGTKGSSKKSSKKSKESFANSADKLRSMEKMTSVSSVKKTANKLVSSRKSSQSGSQVNKRGSSSLSVKRSSVGKRRSTTSASITERKESKSSELILMPDVIPDYPEAWNTFLKDNDTFYKTLLEAYKENENDLQTIYTVYATEIKKLQCYKEVFEKRKNEIFEAQMIRKFNELENFDISQEHLLTISSTEKVSQENFKKAQEDLIEEQEIVLRWQSEIKICLNKRQDIKKQLQDEFDIYCKDKFSGTIPNLTEDDNLFQEETLKIDIEAVNKDDEEDKRCIPKEEHYIRLEDLKKIMQRELLKNMKIKAKERNIWKNYPLKLNTMDYV